MPAKKSPLVKKSLNILHDAALTALCLIPLLLALSRDWADIAVYVTGILFLLRSLIVKDFKWTSQRELHVLALLWALMAANSAFAANPGESARIALTWGRFAVFYAALRYWLLSTPRAFRVVAYSGAAILSFLAFDMLWQYITDESISGAEILSPRIVSLMGYFNIGSLLLKTGLPIMGLLAYEMARRAWHLQLLALLLGLFLIAMVLLSGERSSALLMLLGVNVTGVMCFIERPNARKRLLAGAFAIVFLITALAATQDIVQRRGYYLTQQMSDFLYTPYGQFYAAAGKMWKQHPILGMGAGQFRTTCWQDVQEKRLLRCAAHPHSLYLEWLVDTGIAGLGLLLFALGLMLRRFAQETFFRREVFIPAAFACGTLTVLLWPVIGMQTVFGSWSGILFWYSLSVAVSMPRLLRLQSKKKRA